LAAVDESPGARWLLAGASWALAAAGRGLEAWRVLYAKDGLRRVDAPLGLDLQAFTTKDYEAAVPELLELSALLDPLPRDADGLRWRDFQRSVLFDVSRVVPVRYDDWVERVDVCRTIELMNDYIGGTRVPVARDSRGRVTHQAERNLYLPQPNYLILSRGQPIDVTKLEVCEYGKRFRRMFWKTIRSENDSARYDDGIVTFAADRDGTRVTIFGRQLFVLPPFWEAVQLELAPDFRALLVTHAYATFFRRTLNNFEAVYEGRDIRIGRPWLDPADPWDAETPPVERLEKLLAEMDAPPAAPSRPARVRRDADGFAHFDGNGTPARPANGIGARLFSAARELLADWADLVDAAGADVRRADALMGGRDEDARDGRERAHRRERRARAPGAGPFRPRARARDQSARRARRAPDRAAPR
ncbi:MAG TPA: hypothetical protein VKA21_02340, partial [Candidatus Binatia bacterium]|nr:hypothetical protein [Candidatus Binatia bacterium]